MVFRSTTACILAWTAALSAGGAQGSSGADPDEIRRVVVIHFDTTRVDDFGCYGSFVQTPNVDAVAARGMRYTNAVTCAPYTSPSIATFMTGRYPVHHGVNGVGDRLGQNYTTLANTLFGSGQGFISGEEAINAARRTESMAQMAMFLQYLVSLMNAWG